jgi:SOS-response transcriptional repressor LexA
MNVKEVKRSPLSATQKRYYDFICEFVATRGLFPTLREIVQGTGKKSNGPIQAALFCLKWKGYINRIGTDWEPRGWSLATLPGLPSLSKAIAYKTSEPLDINGTPTPIGAYVLQKDNKMIGCWIPAECIGGSDGTN